MHCRSIVSSTLNDGLTCKKFCCFTPSVHQPNIQKFMNNYLHDVFLLLYTTPTYIDLYTGHLQGVLQEDEQEIVRNIKKVCKYMVVR